MSVPSDAVRDRAKPWPGDAMSRRLTTLVMTRVLAAVASVVLQAQTAAVARAQSLPDLTKPPPVEEMTEPQPHLRWHPAVALTNLGYDTNVFNLPDDAQQPAGDWVVSGNASLAPVWRPGGARLAGIGSLTGNYFQQYDRERGFDGELGGRVDLPVSRLRLHAFGDYQNLKQRVNFEIDQRARRAESRVGAGVDVLIGARTTIGIEGQRNTVAFADDSDVSLPLRLTLNREERVATGSFQYALTPLTSLVVTGEEGQHHFDLSPLRDGSRSGVQAGLMFSRDALVTGQFAVGWRRVTVESPRIPAFGGLTALADLSTVFGISTRVGLRGRRDVVFSADERSPYYVQSSVGASLTQAIGERWEVGVRYDRVLLDYVRSLDEPGSVYREYVNQPGVSLGLKLPGGWRVSVQAERLSRRASNDPSRAYDTTRIYTMFTPNLRF